MHMTISGLGKRLAGVAVTGLCLVAATAFAQSASEDEVTYQELKKEMKEAGEAIKGYSAKQSKEAVRTVKSSIHKMDAYIERMQARLDANAEKMDDAARRKARASLEAIKKQRNEVAQWYERMKDSSADAWEEVKAGFLKSYRSLVNAFDRAGDEF